MEDGGSPGLGYTERDEIGKGGDERMGGCGLGMGQAGEMGSGVATRDNFTVKGRELRQNKTWGKG